MKSLNERFNRNPNNTKYIALLKKVGKFKAMLIMLRIRPIAYRNKFKLKKIF